MTDFAWTPWWGGVRVSRVRISRLNLAIWARHRVRQPSWMKPGQNPGDPLVGCQQSEASLVTESARTLGAKLGFLRLGF